MRPLAFAGLPCTHRDMSIADRSVTHRVDNQPPPLAPYDAFVTDLPLRGALHREGGGWAEPEIATFGELAGGELRELGGLANENKPQLRPRQRLRHRIDGGEFRPP